MFKSLFIFVCILLQPFILVALPKTVVITQIVSHPSLDQVYQGIIHQISEEYPKDQIRIISENAQGNMSTAVQIAQKFVGIKPNLAISISTPSTQALISTFKKQNIPIVFAAVSDPIQAKIVDRLIHHEGYATGIMDSQPIDIQLDLIRKLLPNVKKIGLIYNPGEVNSIQIVQNFKEHACDFLILEATASNSTAVPSAVQKLVSQVDLIYIPSDNTIVSALDSLLGITFAYKIPVVSCDPDLVKKGVLFSAGSSYYQIGQAAGDIAIRILKGEHPKNIDIQKPLSSFVWYNQQSSNKLQIKLNSTILEEYHAQPIH